MSDHTLLLFCLATGTFSACFWAGVVILEELDKRRRQRKQQGLYRASVESQERHRKGTGKVRW